MRSVKHEIKESELAIKQREIEYKELELKALEDEILWLYEAQEAERLKQHEIRERELEAQEADRLKQHELALVLWEFKAVESLKSRNAKWERREAEANAEQETWSRRKTWMWQTRTTWMLRMNYKLIYRNNSMQETWKGLKHNVQQDQFRLWGIR